jgi:hypothetical protein
MSKAYPSNLSLEQYQLMSDLEDVLKVMIDVSNIFYPTLTLPL